MAIEVPRPSEPSPTVITREREIRASTSRQARSTSTVMTPVARQGAEAAATGDTMTGTRLTRTRRGGGGQEGGETTQVQKQNAQVHRNDAWPVHQPQQTNDCTGQHQAADE